MLSKIKRAVMRWVRYVLDYALVCCLYLLIDQLFSYNIPDFLKPYLIGLVAAIMKFIRDSIKLNIPL